MHEVGKKSEPRNRAKKKAGSSERPCGSKANDIDAAKLTKNVKSSPRPAGRIWRSDILIIDF